MQSEMCFLYANTCLFLNVLDGPAGEALASQASNNSYLLIRVRGKVETGTDSWGFTALLCPPQGIVHTCCT